MLLKSSPKEHDMSQTSEPRDAVGNLLLKDNYVAVYFKSIPLFRVVAVENGGIHTANGITPALVRVVSDLILKQIPGAPFDSLIRIATPGAEELLQRIGPTLVKT
jgi:hypothetical protein